ncbi:hypothetical protein B0A49_00397 [Cryomyces minteri]|uniref:Uncharacterized protein n=1 Tax=Cryomyces minteri TaxID=331657 RepID=A0A4U0XTK2_9PEZI|nr:hypothetical protein B0A49_00397 [Cryomyces minteri]
MSSGLMDTEAGGEGTQYESIQTVTEPHKKSSGQLGGAEPHTAAPPSDASVPTEGGAGNARGDRTAENIRYGQNTSESGMGGMTTTSSGGPDQAGAAEGQGQGPGAAETRAESGYGGERDMDRTVGA